MGKTRTAALLLTASLLLTACGGDEKEAEAKQPTVTAPAGLVLLSPDLRLTEGDETAKQTDEFYGRVFLGPGTMSFTRSTLPAQISIEEGLVVDGGGRNEVVAGPAEGEEFIASTVNFSGDRLRDVTASLVIGEETKEVELPRGLTTGELLLSVPADEDVVLLDLTYDGVKQEFDLRAMQRVDSDIALVAYDAEDPSGSNYGQRIDPDDSSAEFTGVDSEGNAFTAVYDSKVKSATLTAWTPELGWADEGLGSWLTVEFDSATSVNTSGSANAVSVENVEHTLTDWKNVEYTAEEGSETYSVWQVPAETYDFKVSTSATLTVEGREGSLGFAEVTAGPSEIVME